MAILKYLIHMKNLIEQFMNLMIKLIYIFLRPVSVGYSLLPNPIEDGISNILQNTGEPINFTNYILQGEIKNALSSLMRFIINSTFGLFGVIDLADKINLKKNDTDFDKTLRKMGAEVKVIIWLYLLLDQDHHVILLEA